MMASVSSCARVRRTGRPAISCWTHGDHWVRVRNAAAGDLLEDQTALFVIGGELDERGFEPAGVADARELPEAEDGDRLVRREDESFDELLEPGGVERGGAGGQDRGRIGLGVGSAAARQ
jgi:hypothetical protein